MLSSQGIYIKHYKNNYIALFFKFNSEGRNLKPFADGCDPGEKRLDIGNVMYIRLTTGKHELVVVQDRVWDNAVVQTVKQLIRQATAIKPEDRRSAAWILQQLKLFAKV